MKAKTLALALLSVGLVGTSVHSFATETKPAAPFLMTNLSSSELEQQAQHKIQALEALMQKAVKKDIDTTREQAALWFANAFLSYAEWDEANQPAVEKFFHHYAPFRADKAMYAANLARFEREQVLVILDEAITTLEQVLAGDIQRRPVNLVDWENVTAGDDSFVSNGKPIFLYDYFSKSMGIPTSNTDVYNDYLGNIDHGPSINPYWFSADKSLNKNRMKQLKDYPDTRVGFVLYWNSNVPQWMSDADPEITTGRSLFTGFDIDNPLMRESWKKLVRKTGKVLKGRKAAEMGYILSNEPHWFSEQGHWTQKFGEMTDISSHTLKKFQHWLDDKYQGDIDQLNTNWGSDFTHFDTVDIAIPLKSSLRGQPIWYDWCRFNMDRSIDWFTFLQNELHAVNPEADTNIKIMPDLFTENNRSHGIDLEALTQLTTMIGDDAKTRGRDLRSQQPEHWEAHYSYFWEELAVAYDFMESVAPNKIHVNSETHFLSSSWWRELDTTPEYVRNTFWLATLMGMDAGLSWFWARDPDGSPEERLEGKLKFFDPAMAGSYAASTAMQPQVAHALTQVMMDLNSYSEEIMALREQRRPVRLFYSETSAINKTQHMTEQFALYESLFFEGFPVGYVTQKVIEQQDASLWDVVVVYKTEYVTDAELAALQHYLDGGGTVVLQQGSLAKNEYGMARTSSLVASKGRLINVDHTASVDDIQVLALAQTHNPTAGVVLTEKNATHHKGVVWRVVESKQGKWMTLVNLGAGSAEVTLTSVAGKPLHAVDMLTGQHLGSRFDIERDGTLLMTLVD